MYFFETVGNILFSTESNLRVDLHFQNQQKRAGAVGIKLIFFKSQPLFLLFDVKITVKEENIDFTLMEIYHFSFTLVVLDLFKMV